MLGHPKYNLGDKVTFTLGDQKYSGIIAIIDKYGTFEDNSDVSYDILVEEPKRCLYKHINETLVD